MITTISLDNIHQHTYLQNFFLVMRTFKIYSLSNFQICNTVLLIIVAMLYITSPWLAHFKTGILFLLTLFTQFLQQIGSHQSVLRICELGFCVCWFLSCLLSVCLLLDSTYKWDSMVFVFFWLISLSTMLYPSICHIWQDFTFLWLNDIPFFNTCHIFFIHWSTDGHLGCLYILATVNNVTVNVGVHISFWVSVFIFIE